MFDSKDIPTPLVDQVDQLIRSPVAVFSAIGALFAVALIATTVSHLGSDTHDRPP